MSTIKDVEANISSSAPSKSFRYCSKNEEEITAPGDVPAQHMNLEFEACYHESNHTLTWKPLKKVLHGCYYWTKLIAYNILVLVIGLKAAFIAALLSALTSFLYTWIWGPLLKNFIFWVHALAPVVTVPLKAVYTPLVDASARVFRQIRINASLDRKSTNKELAYSV